jgi:type II secretory ATPase GspE/PulE/Tfp pilus assembly ATPase PilB-like protein
MSFLDHLVKKKIITQEVANRIKGKGVRPASQVDEDLVSEGVNEGALLRERSEYLEVPLLDLSSFESVANEALRFIPEESARHYQLAPVRFADGVLEIAMVDPDNIESRDALQFISSKTHTPFKIYLVSHKGLERLLGEYAKYQEDDKSDSTPAQEPFPDVADTQLTEPRQQQEEYDGEREAAAEEVLPVDGAGEVSPAVEGVLEESEEGGEGREEAKEEHIAVREEPAADARQATAPAKAPEKEVSVVTNDLESAIKGDAPITKVVGVILQYAIEGNASDVHIEHVRDNVRVRFRIDGVLHTSLLLPANVHNSVVARIKVLANLKLDEKRKPQDGRFSAELSGRKIDFRISTFPAYYGEKVVMRILDPEKGKKSLDTVGLSRENLVLIKKAL